MADTRSRYKVFVLVKFKPKQIRIVPLLGATYRSYFGTNPIEISGKITTYQQILEYGFASTQVMKDFCLVVLPLALDFEVRWESSE